MADPTEAPTEPEATEAPDTTPDPEPAKGDEEAAKWKALARKNEAAFKKAQAELEKAQQASMSEQERAVAQARAEGRADALKEANRKLLHAEVRAAAGGILADPADAVHLLDLDQFDPDNVDSRAIRSALDDLVKAKPYLSAQPGNGAGEGGPRGSTMPLNGDPLQDALTRAVGGPRN